MRIKHDMANGNFSIHRISTVALWGSLLLLVALLASCTRDSGGSPPDRRSPDQQSKKPTAPKETPAQLAYRLRPRLEIADPAEGAPAQTLSPLLNLPQEAPLRVRLVLGYGGTEKLPTTKQLAAFEKLGIPIWSRVSDNLKALRDQEPPIHPRGTASGNTLTAFIIPIDRPGAEALILLPELWDYLVEQSNGKTFWAALPSRALLFFIVDEPKNVKNMGRALQEIYTKASVPMIDRFLLRKDGKLLPGPTFREAGKD